MKTLTHYMSEILNESIQTIKDGTCDETRLDDIVREIANDGLNATIALTTYQMAQRVAKKWFNTRQSRYDGVFKNGRETYSQLERVLEKYFNCKQTKSDTYWFDKSRKSINVWLKMDNRGTMENPNI